MMRWYGVVTGLVLCVIFTVDGWCGEAEVDRLMRWLPARANTVVVIDAERVYGSAMSAREGWSGSSASAKASRPVRLPAGTEKVVMAARLTMPELMATWEVAVVKLKLPLSIETIASADGGYMDMLGDKPSILTAEDIYIVDLGSNVLAAVHPGDRQFTSKWMSQGDEVTGSAYLRYAVEQAADEKAAVVMGLDLGEAVLETKAREYLEGSEILEGSDADIFGLGQLVAGMRGVRLSVVIDEQATGKFTVDFEDEVNLSPRLAQLIVMDIVGATGEFISDLDKWSVAVEGKQVILQGQLTSTGLRRVMSLVEFAGPSGESQSEFVMEGLSPEAAATVEHLQQVMVLVEDLRKREGTGSYKNVALWMDRYAKQIDHLGILNVDQKVQEYSAEVARLMRDGARSLRDISSQMTEEMARERKTVYSNSSRSGSSSYSRSRQDYARRQQQRREEMERQKQKRQQISLRAKSAADKEIGRVMQSIDDMTRSLRMEMTEKYGVEIR